MSKIDRMCNELNTTEMDMVDKVGEGEREIRVYAGSHIMLAEGDFDYYAKNRTTIN